MNINHFSRALTLAVILASEASAQKVTRPFFHAAGNGPVTYVVLTGMVGGVGAFTKLENELTVRGHRVVVIDTYTLSLDSADVTFAGMARRVDAILDIMNIRDAQVVGHSHGAGVALRLAANYPRRVSRLYFLNAGALESNNTPAVAASLKVARFIAHFPGGRRFVESKLADGIRENSAHTEWFDQRTQQKYTRPLMDDLGRVAAMTNRFASQREPESLPAVLKRIHVPIFLILAGVITSGGAGAEELNAIRPIEDLIQVEVIAGVGHFMHEEAPGQVAALLLQPAVRRNEWVLIKSR